MALIGGVIFVAVALATLVAAHLAMVQAERGIRTDSERELTQYATKIRGELAAALETRRSIVQATAVQIVALSDRSDRAVRRHLEAVQAQFPEFTWFGAVDENGRVLAAGGGILEGDDVSRRPWYQKGRQQSMLGEVHQALLLEKVLPRIPDGQPLRLLDVAVPLPMGEGRASGALGAHLSWAWVGALQTQLLRSLDAAGGLQLLLAAEDGTLVAAPPEWLGRKMPAQADFAAQGSYLVGRHAPYRAGDGGLAWTVILRQDEATALAPARDVRNAVLLTGLLGALASALTAAGLTWVLVVRPSGLAPLHQA